MTEDEFKKLLDDISRRTEDMRRMAGDMERLKISIQRLCDVVEKIDRNVYDGGHRTTMELIRQYVRGDLEPRYETTVEPPGPHDGPPFPYWGNR